jgi:hypothetical protein
VGQVVHYYDQAGAAVVRLTDGSLRVGDTVHIRGHTTDFYERITRLEVDHVSVDSAAPGQEVAVQVSRTARVHDVVYVLSQ